MAQLTQVATDNLTVPILHAIRGFDGKTLAKDLKCLDALEEHVVSVADARLENDLSLEGNGFSLIRHKSEVSDYFDQDLLKTTYAREMGEFIGGVTGSEDVVIFDTVLRGSASLMERNPENRIYEYAFKAHSDGDGDTFLHMAAMADPETTARCKGRRFAVYTVWRPLALVEEKPLALCDGATVQADDLVAAYYSGYDELAELHPDLGYPPPSTYFHLAYSPGQRWYYYPGMTAEEVLIFKQWDSAPSDVLCVPHSAFEHPDTRPNAAPRTAVEARAVVFLS